MEGKELFMLIFSSSYSAYALKHFSASFQVAANILQTSYLMIIETKYLQVQEHFRASHTFVLRWLSYIQGLMFEPNVLKVWTSKFSPDGQLAIGMMRVSLSCFAFWRSNFSRRSRIRKEGQAILKAKFDRASQVIDSLNVVKSMNVSMRMIFLLSLFTMQPRYSFRKFCLRQLEFRMEAGGIHHLRQAYSSCLQVSGTNQTTSEPKGFGNVSRCRTFSVKDICHDVFDAPDSPFTMTPRHNLVNSHQALFAIVQYAWCKIMNFSASVASSGGSRISGGFGAAVSRLMA